MKYDHLTPIKHQYSNGILTGGAFHQVNDLPVIRYKCKNTKEDVVACYYRLTVWQRIKFLFCGKLFVQVLGRTTRPLAVGIGEFFAK